MPRRKNRTIYTTEDGWSIIPGHNRNPLRLKPSSSSSTTDELKPSSVTSKVLTVRLTAAKIQLESYAPLSPLRTVVSSLPPGYIKTVLVLGLGSLVGATYKASMLQLAAVSEIDSLLGGTAEVLFKDPAFTSLDVTFLETLGSDSSHSKVAGRWRANGEEDEKFVVREIIGKGPLVVVAPHLDFDVLERYLTEMVDNETSPVLLFCNDIHNFLNLAVGDAKQWNGLRRYLSYGAECRADRGNRHLYRETVLAGVEKGQEGTGRAFNDLAVYWRQDAMAVSLM